MNWKRAIGGFVALIILVAGGYWGYMRFLAPQPETTASLPDVNTVAVDTGVDVVSAEASLEPARWADLAPLRAGRVAELLVQAGDEVAAGAPLLRLEAADLTAALAQAEAGVAQANAGIAAAAAQLSAAQAGVLAAQTAIEVAEAQLALAQSAPLPAEIAALQSSVDVAAAAVSQAAANRDAALQSATAAQIQSAQAQLAAAQADERVVQDQYDELIRNDVGGTLEEQTRFALNAARARVAAAQAALAELQAGPTVAQQRAANAAVPVAAAQQAAAQAQLDLLLAGSRPEQIAVAQAQVNQAKVGLTQAEAAAAQAEAAVAQAEAALRQAEAGRDVAQAALDQMTLIAPFAGTVARVDVEVGEIVSPGLPVITLADYSGWQVKTSDLTESDVVAVAVGDAVTLRFDAIPEETLTGVVVDIAGVSTVTRGDITYAVTISLDDARSLPLRWGMTVFADIEVGE
ncbi:MAG: hypothetical protein Fur0021_09260 [Candidatus Promineifilaceae bacterium]